ncbi:MAG: hypothetical protein E7191_06615 [Erysipelotrichaceae bacterium]|nr:hypothetical protein [Erysipelotrichaceae bacterium]
MVKIYVAEEDIRIVTTNMKITRKSYGNIDEAMYKVLRDIKDPNIEIISWFHRYKMIQKQPRNTLEQKISDILNSKGVTYRKFTDGEWEVMKDQIKERIFYDAINRQKRKEASKK